MIWENHWTKGSQSCCFVAWMYSPLSFDQHVKKTIPCEYYLQYDYVYEILNQSEVWNYPNLVKYLILKCSWKSVLISSYYLLYSSILILTDIVLFYGIIWYERFGSDQPRTLLNQQVASICWSGILWIILMEIPMVIRFLTKQPFNVNVCKVQMLLNQVWVTARLEHLKSGAIAERLEHL